MGIGGRPGLRSFVSSGVVFCLIAPCGLRPLRAQQAQPAAGLRIVILEGDGAVNNIRQRTAREPIVQVEDENHRPIAGAIVTFLLPDQGAGASFADGSRTLTVLTDSKGQAAARGLRPNQVSGKFQIRVSASHAGQTTSTTITQSNAAAAAAATAGGISVTKLVVILAVAGAAAAAGGVVLATRGGGNAANTPAPTTIAPGTGSVGAPR